MRRVVNKIYSTINAYALNGIIKNRYGDFSNPYTWKCSLSNVAKKWLYKIPIVPVTENYKHPLMAKLLRLNRNASIQSWQNAGLIEGLFVDKNLQDFSDLCRKWINEEGEWKITPNTIDHSLLAYMLLKYTENTDKIKPAMDKMYETIKAEQTSEGTIPYRRNMPELRLVDTLGMICPFLMLYGKIYKQMDNFIENGLESSSGLPYHAYNVNTREHIGVNAWGRGIGWYILGLESFIECEKYRKIIFSLADTLLLYQRKGKGFPWLITFTGQCETSGTSLIGNLYLDCYELSGDAKYFSAAEDCITALMECTTNRGILWNAQGDSKGIGLYSHEFGLMPFAQGYALKLASRFINIKEKI